MGLGGRLRRMLGTAVGESRPDGLADVHVADPRFDDWEVVREFDELETARAFAQAVAERRLETALTSDWPLDRFGRGEIALRVPRERWSEATELLDGLDLD